MTLTNSWNRARAQRRASRHRPRRDLRFRGRRLFWDRCRQPPPDLLRADQRPQFRKGRRKTEKEPVFEIFFWIFGPRHRLRPPVRLLRSPRPIRVDPLRRQIRKTSKPGFLKIILPQGSSTADGSCCCSIGTSLNQVSIFIFSWYQNEFSHKVLVSPSEATKLPVSCRAHRWRPKEDVVKVDLKGGNATELVPFITSLASETVLSGCHRCLTCWPHFKLNLVDAVQRSNNSTT